VKKITLAIALLILAAGCSQRTLTINSDPEGARIIFDHQEIGVTPLEIRFQHYGNHSLILLKHGWEPYRGKLVLDTPGWAVFPLDLVTEAINPVKIRDKREVTIKLEKPPVRDISSQDK